MLPHRLAELFLLFGAGGQLGTIAPLLDSGPSCGHGRQSLRRPRVRYSEGARPQKIKASWKVKVAMSNTFKSMSAAPYCPSNRRVKSATVSPSLL